MIPLPVIDDHAARHPDAAAIIDDLGSTTWSSYADRVRLVSEALVARLDPDSDNRAVLIGKNRADYVIVASALASLGVPWVGLDPLGDPDVINHQVSEVAPTVIVSTPAGYSMIADTVAALAHPPLLAGFSGDASGAFSFAATRPSTLHNDPAGQSTWRRPPFLALGFTSGTTGLPKLVLRTTPSEQRRSETLVDRYRFGRGDTHLVTVPFSHASGHGWARLFLAVGATVVLTDDPEPSRLVTLAAAHRVRTTLMVPPLLAEFVAAAEDSPSADLSALRFVLTGGRPMYPRVLRRALARLGSVVSTYYGTTETGVNLVADPADLAVKPGAAGQPLPGNHVLVLGPDRRPVRSGVVGRVALSSYMAMAGYARHDADIIEHDGRNYVLTADYGRLDAHAYLVLTNRDDGLPGADTVPAIQSEGDLLEIAGVADAAIVRAATTDSLLPRVDAAIVTTPGADIELAIKHADYVLDHHLPEWIPRAVTVVPAIPYSRTGKLRAEALRDLIADTALRNLIAAGSTVQALAP